MKTDTTKIFTVTFWLTMFMCTICVSEAQSNPETCALEYKYTCPKSSKECCWRFQDFQFQAVEDITSNNGKRPNILRENISKAVICVAFIYWFIYYVYHLTCPLRSHLTAHNWQKWKRVFLTCPCHKIYRDEAVGLKSCKYTRKITIFVKMLNLGQYCENLIFCQ